MAGSAVSDAIGGGLGGAVGGVVGDVAGNLLDQTGVGGLLDQGIGAVTDLASDVVGGAVDLAGDIAEGAIGAVTGAAGQILGGVAGGIRGVLPESAESTFGKIEAQAGELTKSVTDAIPTNLDGLSGLLGADNPLSEILGGEQNTEADIVMYMPFNINETYQANWSTGELGIAGTVGKTLGAALQGTDAKEGAAKLLEAVKQQASMTNVKGAAAEAIGTLAGAGMNNDALRKKALKMAGVAINPHFEIFFDSPSPRNFTFDFKMSPRNAQEALAIQQIVRTFKQYVAPSLNDTGANGRYWDYPAYFLIEYWNAEQLHLLKRCALQNITVNYSATGTNHTFYDGAPIQTDMTLQFMESELITRQDFQKGY